MLFLDLPVICVMLCMFCSVLLFFMFVVVQLVWKVVAFLPDWRDRCLCFAGVLFRIWVPVFVSGCILIPIAWLLSL